MAIAMADLTFLNDKCPEQRTFYFPNRMPLTQAVCLISQNCVANTTFKTSFLIAVFVF